MSIWKILYFHKKVKEKDFLSKARKFVPPHCKKCKPSFEELENNVNFHRKMKVLCVIGRLEGVGQRLYQEAESSYHPFIKKNTLSHLLSNSIGSSQFTKKTVHLFSLPFLIFSLQELSTFLDVETLEQTSLLFHYGSVA